MYKRRGTILALALFALLTASAAAAYQYFVLRLPEPATADRNGLFRWLVTTDVATHPKATRDQLIDRFETELDEGIDLRGVGEQIDPAQARLLWQNVDFLLGEWFCDRANRYAQLPAEEQPAFVDARIAQVEGWGLVDQLLAANTTSPDSEPVRKVGHIESLTRLKETIDVWIERAPPEQQANGRKLLLAVQTQLVWRSLRAALPQNSPTSLLRTAH